MRVALSICVWLAATPALASAQITVVEVTEEEALAYREQEKVSHAFYGALDALEQERLKDAGYRSVRVAGARFINERLVNVWKYPGYTQQLELEQSQYRELALNDSEYGQLLDLLAEFDVQDMIHGLQTSGTIVALDRDGSTPESQASSREWLRKRTELQRQREAGITNLLGADRYQLWQQYLKQRKRWQSGLLPGRTQQSLEVLYRLLEVQRVLNEAHQPLQISQVMPLAVALTAGVQREQVAEGRRDDIDPQAVSSTEFQSAAKRRVGENRQGILESVAPLLPEPQRAALLAGFRQNTAD